MATYDVGAPVRVSVSFYNILNQLTDPTAVTFRYQPPNQARTSKTSPDVVKDGTGQYHIDLDTTGWGSGVVPYRWEGTGLLIAAVDGTFTLAPSPFYP